MARSRIAVSGAIYLPKGRHPSAAGRLSRGRTVRQGTADVCAPSWMERGTRDTDYLNAWLGQGSAVVASYQGLGTPAAILDGGAAGGLERARQRAVGAPGVSAIGERGRRQPRGVACRAVRYGAGPALRAGSEDQGDGRDRSGRPLYAASRSTAPALLFLLLHKFQAIESAFRPSDYLTEAGGARLRRRRHRRAFGPAPAVPLDPLLKAWPDHAKVPAVEDWPTLHFTHPLFIGTGLTEISPVLPAVQSPTAAAAPARAGAEKSSRSAALRPSAGRSTRRWWRFVAGKLFAGRPVAGRRALKPPPTN